MILRRLRAWWRHRPRRAILAFFDVQPITVKAYGGRRYTRISGWCWRGIRRPAAGSICSCSTR